MFSWICTTTRLYGVVRRKKREGGKGHRDVLLLTKIVPGRLLPSKRVRWRSRRALLLSHSKLRPILGRRNAGEDLGRRDTDTEGAEVDETDCANYCRRGLQPLRQNPWQCQERLYRSPGPVPQAQRSERTEVQLDCDDSLIRREPARITEDNQIATNANAENEAAVTHDEADRDSG